MNPHKVQPILGTKRILKSIGLSHSKMYYWIEKKKCQNSIFQLCQPRHPNQLLPTEVDIVKNYLLDERFKIGVLFPFIIRPFVTKQYLWESVPGINTPIV